MSPEDDDKILLKVAVGGLSLNILKMDLLMILVIELTVVLLPSMIFHHQKRLVCQTPLESFCCSILALCLLDNHTNPHLLNQFVLSRKEEIINTDTEWSSVFYCNKSFMYIVILLFVIC